ncbi:MAG: anti-sigma F factor antagonist [Firmicutes bacterium]|nr:anti-sigma F factor antagonist [Bacillota bacterium]
MDMIFNIKENILVAELFGELDHYAAGHVREDIEAAMESCSIKKVVFDFTKVTFMDSSGIGMILGRYRKLTDEGGGVAVCSCSSPIRNILNMAGVFSIIDYFDTPSEAVDFLCGKEVS